MRCSELLRAVTAAASDLRLSATTQPSRQPYVVAELGIAAPASNTDWVVQRPHEG